MLAIGMICFVKHVEESAKTMCDCEYYFLKNTVLDVFSSVKEGVAHLKALFPGVHHPNFVAPLLISIDMSQRVCTPVLVLLSTL